MQPEFDFVLAKFVNNMRTIKCAFWLEVCAIHRQDPWRGDPFTWLGLFVSKLYAPLWWVTRFSGSVLYTVAVPKDMRTPHVSQSCSPGFMSGEHWSHSITLIMTNLCHMCCHAKMRVHSFVQSMWDVMCGTLSQQKFTVKEPLKMLRTDLHSHCIAGHTITLLPLNQSTSTTQSEWSLSSNHDPRGHTIMTHLYTQQCASLCLVGLCSNAFRAWLHSIALLQTYSTTLTCVEPLALMPGPYRCRHHFPLINDLLVPLISLNS